MNEAPRLNHGALKTEMTAFASNAKLMAVGLMFVGLAVVIDGVLDSARRPWVVWAVLIVGSTGIVIGIVAFLRQAFRVLHR